MANDISNREPVAVDQNETSDAALRQLEGRMCPAGSEANQEYCLIF